VPQTLDARKVRSRLDGKTTFELCEDFVLLVNSPRRIVWAEQAISDVLFERNEVAWVEWQLGGQLFGPARPHRFFGLI